MIGISPLAPEYHAPVGEWFERHLANCFNQPPHYSCETDSIPSQSDDLVAQAKTHLSSMLTMDTYKRITYLKVNGCSDPETAFVMRLQSSWLDNGMRNKVTEIAKECLAKKQEFGFLLNRWPGRDDTQRLIEMLQSKGVKQHHLLISYATCQAAELAFRVYSEAKESLGKSGPMPKSPVLNPETLPEILHEPSRSLKEQLNALVGLDTDQNNHDTKTLSRECVEWFIGKLDEHWLPNMPIPFAFPTESGDLSIEWFVGHAEHSLEVDFTDSKGRWGWWNSKSDEEYEETLDLNQAEAWEKLRTSSIGQRPAP